MLIYSIYTYIYIYIYICIVLKHYSNILILLQYGGMSQYVVPYTLKTFAVRIMLIIVLYLLYRKI